MANEQWPRIRLGDVVSIKHGWAFAGHHFSESARHRPIVVNIGNFRYSGGFRFEETTVRHYTGEYPSEYLHDPGDILLVMTCQTPGGEILGIPGRIPNDGRQYLHNQRLGKVVVTDPQRVDSDYLYWLFLTPSFNSYLATTASGTKILHTSPGRIESFELELPPLSEQRAIAGILGALDDKIELNRRMNATLEELARALFTSWFVDFDPVRAKAEGRQPAGIDAATAALFPDAFEESAIGPIPRGWRVGAFGDIAINARRGVAPEDLPPETPYMGLEHMPGRSIALAEWGTAADVTSNKHAFRQGEILFGKLRPYFHKVGVAPLDGVCSTDILVIAPHAPEWFGFALLHASSADLVEFATARSDGTRMPRTSWHDLSQYPLVIPSEDVARTFTHRVLPIVQAIHCNIRQSRTLAAIRDALLPKLLSGAVRVREAKTMVEAAI